MKCCEFYAGRLKHVATLQEYVATDDGYGGKTYEWRSVGNINCRFVQKNNKETNKHDAIENTSSYDVEARYDAKIKPNMRLCFNNEAFKIIGINNVEFENKWLVLSVERGVAT